MRAKYCPVVAFSILLGSVTWLCPSSMAQSISNLTLQQVARLTPEQLSQRLPQPDPPPTSQQAAEADQRQGDYFDVNGARIFYQVVGQGTPLLLIHGFPLSGQLYQYQLAQLSKQFQVITPDLRGFGKSQTPDGNATIATYAQDMLALLDHLGLQQAIIGGHSMGGQVTLEMYKEAPQRFAGMLLLDTNPMAASFVEQGEWPGFGNQAKNNGVPSIVPIAAPQLLTGVTLALDKTKAKTMMDILAEGSVNGVIGGGHALATRSDYTGLLGNITVPTLVVVGLDDPVYAFPIAQMTQAAIPNAQLAVIPGASHASMFERPALFNTAVLDWANQ